MTTTKAEVTIKRIMEMPMNEFISYINKEYGTNFKIKELRNSSNIVNTVNKPKKIYKKDPAGIAPTGKPIIQSECPICHKRFTKTSNRQVCCSVACRKIKYEQENKYMEESK